MSSSSQVPEQPVESPCVRLEEMGKHGSERRRQEEGRRGVGVGSGCGSGEMGVGGFGTVC